MALLEAGLERERTTKGAPLLLKPSSSKHVERPLRALRCVCANRLSSQFIGASLGSLRLAQTEQEEGLKKLLS